MSLFTQEQETNCTGRLCEQREKINHHTILYHNTISNPNKEKPDKSLHIGDATSMSNVSDSVEKKYKYKLLILVINQVLQKVQIFTPGN